MSAKKIQRRGSTMATYYGPPDTKYSQPLFVTLIKKIMKILKPKQFSAVSEPFPNEDVLRKSLWHMHIMLVFEGRKTITPNMQQKIQTLLNVPFCTHDYTSRENSTAGLQKEVNDAKYAMGMSCKDEANGGNKKTHYDRVRSSGYLSWVTGLEEKLAHDKLESKDLGGFDISKPAQYAYALMKNRNLKPHQIYRYAEKEGNLALELYVADNLSKLEDLYGNIKKLQAEMLLDEAPDLVPNVMQEQALKIIESSTNKRDEGQLNCFLDELGNTGKSELQNMLYKTYGAPEFPNAKTADIAKAYNYEKMVNFNFARHVDMERVNYSAIENLLDGKIFSSKYHSGMKRVAKPQVNMFTNSLPILTKMSMDRWNIYAWDPKRQKFDKQIRGVDYDSYYEPPTDCKCGECGE